MVTLRIRSVLWFFTGMMLAVVSVWVFAALRASAVDPAESSVVPVTPERILDTRDPNNVGLPGPFLSQVPQKLQVTGMVQTASPGGPVMKQVVPAGAVGVVLNVTPVNATRDGFISVEPGNAVGAPTTSSLNFTAGSINPNSVTVSLPTAGPDAGKIRLTYDAYGFVGPSTDILVDVVGYTTNAGLTELANRVLALESDSHTIPSGVTVTGNFTWDAHTDAAGRDYRFDVALPGRAPVGLGDGTVNFAPSPPTTADGDSQCNGTAAAPTAPAGKVCLYLTASTNVVALTGRSDGFGGAPFLKNQGFVIQWNSNAAGDMYVNATWAYTAP